MYPISFLYMINLFYDRIGFALKNAFGLSAHNGKAVFSSEKQKRYLNVHDFVLYYDYHAERKEKTKWSK